MPLDQFIDKAYEGLAAGKEEVTVGDAEVEYNKFEPARQKAFHDFVEAIKPRYD